MLNYHVNAHVEHSGRVVERQAFGRGNWGSKPLAAVSELGSFIHFTLPVSFGRETLKAVGPFYVVSMPGEVKDHTQGNGKPVVDSVCLIELVISISKLTILPPSLAVISRKGSISSSIKLCNINYVYSISSILAIICL